MKYPLFYSNNNRTIFGNSACKMYMARSQLLPWIYCYGIFNGQLTMLFNKAEI